MVIFAIARVVTAFIPAYFECFKAVFYRYLGDLGDLYLERSPKTINIYNTLIGQMFM